MTDKIVELSRGVVRAATYGESIRWVGVDQVNVLMVTADMRAGVEAQHDSGDVVGRFLELALMDFLAARVSMA